MDFDFDDEPAAPAARAGAKFKPRGRPQPKKKQVSVSTSQTTLPTDVAKEKLSTQSEDPVSLDASSTYPSNVSTSETIVPDGGIINQSTMGTITKENVIGGEASVPRACTNLNSEGRRCEDDAETAPAYPDDPRRQDSATFGDSVTHEADEVINDQTQRMQTEEGEECHWNMETLDIVQEEGITGAYEQHSGKFQPKPRLLDTVIEEEPESHYSVDDTTGANQSEFMVNEESRNDESNTNTEDQEEEHNIPEVHKETAPGVLEQEDHVVPPSNNDTVMGQGETQSNEAETRTDKKGKKKRGRKKKATTNEEEEEEEANKSPKKKFKHSSRRQKNRTLEKELLETADDDIKYLPIRDMLRLVEYKEWLAKKEAKGAPVVPPTQESNTHASQENQYYSQAFDAEDEFGMEDGENQENHVEVKPDSPVNYQTYMNKTPRVRWSKQDTQLFYEGIQEFGSNLSMVQQLFPERTRQQIKLKYKLEERKNPLKLNDALSTRSKQLTHYHSVIKKLQQEAAAAKEGEEEDEEEEAGDEAETTTDVPENEEQTKSEKTDERAGDGVAGVKESDGGDVENGVRSDGGDEFDENEGDDDEFWNSYKSEM